jgi:hypothetical protein
MEKDNVCGFVEKMLCERGEVCLCLWSGCGEGKEW